MAFWGVEVKPRKPFTLKATESKRLHLSQATLGHGNGTERIILQCNVGNKSPVLLCALSPDKVDFCQLNLEFDEVDDVIFSVLGARSLHLTGYFLGRSTGFRPNDDDESESYGEDVGYSDKEKVSSDDYDYNDSFINDEDPYVRGSHVSSTDDDEISIKEMAAKTKDKKKNGKGGRLRKKFQVSDSDSDEILADESSNEDSVEVVNNGKHKIRKVHSSESPLPSRVTRSSKARRSTLVKGEPNAKSENTSEARTHTHKTLDKREDKPLGDVKLSPIQKDSDDLSKKKEYKESFRSSAIINLDDGEGKSLENEKPATEKWGNKSSSDVLSSQNGDATPSKKKRKREKREETSDVQKNQLECSETKKQAIDMNIEKEASTQKPLESETSSNGVIIEEIEKTKFDGKSAVKGKKVSILYTGKLKDTGKLFESNLGEAPLRFRLGGEKVIEGLSIGVEGMRVGDKRRIIIPPSLGYSEERLREDVPKNAWLVYEVEAVKTR